VCYGRREQYIGVSISANNTPVKRYIELLLGQMNLIMKPIQVSFSYEEKKMKVERRTNGSRNYLIRQEKNETS
jgi:hypothetical protein